MSEQPIDDVRLDKLIDRIDVNTASLKKLKAETEAENVKRIKRIFWSRIAWLFATTAAVVGIAVGILGLSAAHSAHDAANKANTALTVSVATRTANQQSVCDGFEAFTNALIGLSPPAATDDARAAQQVKIDHFEQDLESRLAALHCDLKLIPAR